VTVELVPVDVRGSDRDTVIAFLTADEWPFHVRRRPTAEGVRAAIEAGAFDDEDHAAFWVVDGEQRVGLAVLEDLTDDTPLFDLRLAAAARGRGLGLAALRALTEHVFATRPQTVRFEGQTREDNVAMRRVFRRAGFVKEAHYREAWHVDGGTALASVGYGVLRRDWSSGSTTPLVWDDEPAAGRS
jgi:RimJ/RimL family protein N-acetyltransferase